MSRSEPVADDLPASPPRWLSGSRSLVIAFSTMALVCGAMSWGGYHAVMVAKRTLAAVGGHDALVAVLTQQAQLLLGTGVVGGLFMVGVVFLLRYAMTRRSEDDAKRAGQQQLAALGRMSAVLAHEIRNPLASLKGHAQLLAEQLDSGTREHRKAERVVQEALRLEVLTNSLLDFVRAGKIERKCVDPRRVVRRAVDTIKSERISVDDRDAPSNFSLDSVRIEQLLVNLLRNALQADVNARVELTLKMATGGLVFTVKDNGPGLPEGGKRVFESFRTTKTRGTGLGLSVARRIVELHGGRIEAVDLPSGGALFVATIPRETD